MGYGFCKSYLTTRSTVNREPLCAFIATIELNCEKKVNRKVRKVATKRTKNLCGL